MSASAKRMIFSELSLWLVVAALGFYFLMPIRQNVRFGIDLVGGTFLTLEVQVDKAVESELVDRRQLVKQALKSADACQPCDADVERNSLVLRFDTLQQAQDASEVLKATLKDMEFKSEGSTLVYTFADRKVEAIKRDAVDRNIEVLRTRVNKLGVADIPIAAQGEKNIVIELPDVSDPQQAKSMIGKAAQLEFRIVEKIFGTQEDADYELDAIPSDKELLAGRDGGVYLVEKYAQVGGRELKNARVEFDEGNGTQLVVAFEFSDEGGTKFYNLTSRNVGKPLAVVLDGVVISAPRISEGIRKSGRISGNFSKQEATELALLLKSGAFVAPVTFEEERQIGPSLGAESIRQGVIACIVGLALLFLFSVFYYKVAGLIAFAALVFNLALILFGMSWLGATLTLPGIAGMLLTIGMAIDSAILIFERVKEEMAKGIPFKQALDVGFSDAMWVILDANITTLVVGIVLYYFGTGPIKGFAVTMILGIIATLISSLRFMRSLFRFVLNNFGVQNLKI